MLCDRLGYQIQSVAIAWHIFTLRHEPLDLGLVGLALFLPNLLFSIPAGVCADRFDRRYVVCCTSIFEAFGLGMFVIAISLHVTALWLYLSVLFLIGTGWAIAAPSLRSLLPNVVPRDAFVASQAQYSAIKSLLVIAGPAVGGLLVAVGMLPALYSAMVLLLLTAGTMVRLPMLARVKSGLPPPGIRESLDGLRFIRSQPLIAGAISLDLFAVLFGGATALLPAFADGIFHVGPVGLGLLRSAPAAGAAIVATVLARRPPRYNVGITLLIAVMGFGIATIAFGLSKNFIFSLGALAIVGGTDMVSVVIRNALVQLTTPDHMRGRVSAFENIFIGASNELGEFESGTLAAWIGVVPAVVVGGVGTLAVITLWSIFFPALRKAHDLHALHAATEITTAS